MSEIGRRRANERLSPFTEYCLAGKVTFRPFPPLRSQTLKPISLRPSSGPSVKCSSASASFPGGLVPLFGVNFQVTLIMLHLLAVGEANPMRTTDDNNQIRCCGR